MISLTQLEYLLAVERLRHFGNAAKECHVAQPSLSLQIQKAEETLGYLLFEREKKPIEPTPKGVRFLEQARVVWAEHQRLMLLAKQDEGRVCGEFHLGVIPTVLPFLVPYFLAEFSKNFPDVTLQIRELTTDICLEEIRHNRLDGAILATPLKEKGIRERPLYYESFWLYAHPNSPHLENAKVHISDIAPEELWLLMDGHCLRKQILSFCNIQRSQSHFHNVRLHGGSLDVLRHVINRSWGCTLIPKMMRDYLSADEKELQTRQFQGAEPLREVSLVFAREQWKSDILNALEDTILSCLPKSVKKTSNEKVAKEHILLPRGDA
jgi:LysR family transcriptional regulator, hydrogen peroxide-inducible genes activator